MTYSIDTLTIGVAESLSHTVTARDIDLFGEATGDRNPVHFDETFARKTVFRGRVAHGALSIGFISAVIGMKLPGPGTIFLSTAIAFKDAVRIGDTVVTICTVREIRARREIILDCRCMVGDKIVVEGEAVVLAPRRPAEPAKSV